MSLSLKSSIKNLFGSNLRTPIGEAEDKPQYFEEKFLNSSVISGSLAKFVRLPKYVSRIEWIATHGIDNSHLSF
jgi:hypothetical protein